MAESAQWLERGPTCTIDACDLALLAESSSLPIYGSSSQLPNTDGDVDYAAPDDGSEKRACIEV